MNASRSAAATGVTGLVMIIIVTSLLGLPQAEVVQLVGIAGSAALVTGLMGAIALRLLRGSSFTAQVVVVALTSTAAVTAGALAGGNVMFFDAHDLQVLSVVVTVGAVVSIVVAQLLGARVGAASRSLGEVARRLGHPDAEAALDLDAADLQRAMPEDLIAEFRGLADQLEATRCELESSRERERATDRARRELVSWVSHDLRTPLAGIRAITELLEDDILEDPEEVRTYYATLRRESDKLAGLVQDLFEVSRIEAGAIRLEPVDINLGDLVTDTVAGAVPVAEQRGIRVVGRVADPTATISGGLPELSRVLRNLVSNAVRESADGGTVLVEAGLVPTPSGYCGFLAVQDSCGGIPDHVIDRVFEASYRGESARTPRSEGGGGLGLAIARGFVEAHGGAISVGNVADGCRFYVTVPLQQEGDAPGMPMADEADMPPLPLGRSNG